MAEIFFCPDQYYDKQKIKLWVAATLYHIRVFAQLYLYLGRGQVSRHK